MKQLIQLKQLNNEDVSEYEIIAGGRNGGKTLESGSPRTKAEKQ